MSYDDESERQLRSSRDKESISLRIKIEVLSTRLQELNDKVKELVKDHEGRIRTLESFRWWILGACSIASFLGNMFASLIFKK